MSEYREANAAQRYRLQLLAERITDTDLDRCLANGITVAQELIHLAFWDDYCAARLEQWERTGYEPIVVNYDSLNAAILTLALHIPARSAIDLALCAAEAADSKVETVSPELAAAIVGGGSSLLNRSGHRRTHLDQIEAALA